MRFGQIDDFVGPIVALRTLRSPQAIPALRPIQPAPRGTPLAAITDGLVEATDTLDSVLRTHLPPSGGIKIPAKV